MVKVDFMQAIKEIEGLRTSKQVEKKLSELGYYAQVAKGEDCPKVKVTLEEFTLWFRKESDGWWCYDAHFRTLEGLRKNAKRRENRPYVAPKYNQRIADYYRKKEDAISEARSAIQKKIEELKEQSRLLCEEEFEIFKIRARFIEKNQSK